MAKDPKTKKDFFKNFKAELKKVIWPTPKQVLNNTVAVVTIVLIAAVIVFALDLAFDLFNSAGINGLKSRIQEDTNIVDNQIPNDSAGLENNEIQDNEIEEDEIESDIEVNEIAE